MKRFHHFFPKKRIKNQGIKKILIMGSICFLTIQGFSQEVLNFPYSTLNFEDSSEYKFVLTDTTGIWQIAKPSKEILYIENQTDFGEYAIISDTNQYYQKNISASFQIKLNFDSDMNIYHLSFNHKYDFEKNKDGGMLETSYDGGLNWQNILYDTIIFKCIDYLFSVGFYDFSDTILAFENKPGFTGIQSEFKYVELSFYSHQVLRYDIDTFLLRFTMASDSIDATNEGWLIDNLVFGGALVEIKKYDYKNYSIYPNPAKNLINIHSRDEPVYKVEIYNITGRKILEKHHENRISVQSLKSGMYYIRINERIVGQFVIE